MRVEYNDLNVHGITCGRPACVRSDELDPTEEQFLPLQVLNCKYEEVHILFIFLSIKQLLCTSNIVFINSLTLSYVFVVHFGDSKYHLTWKNSAFCS